MKLETKLAEQLAALARSQGKTAEQILTDLIGDVCPTCGRRAPPPERHDRKRPGPKGKLVKGISVKRAILEFANTDSEYGWQSRCAKAVGTSRAYVSFVWKGKR